MSTPAAKRDSRPYPRGEGNDARLQRYLVDHSTDQAIRDAEEDNGQTVTMTGVDLYRLLFDVAEHFYNCGTADVRDRHGLW